MKHIKLCELDVSRIGLGAMSMSHAYTGAGTDDADPPKGDRSHPCSHHPTREPARRSPRLTVPFWRP